MIRVLVSSCLLGELVRYDGGHVRADSRILAEWQRTGRVVTFCPEVAGGLSVPRAPAEVRGGGGDDVLRGRAHVADGNGDDVTEAFLSGARAAVDAAARHGVKLAVLKENSPSCGSSHIYDGTFTGARIAGQGVTTAALTRAGVRVFSEDQLVEARAFLDELEAGVSDDEHGRTIE